ncbi:MAG TPA: hypothetical protein PLM09_03805 [Casimicrobiaceae bacterium]|nr:hypothetical protein [Casimicrobiaceae bacterium]
MDNRSARQRSKTMARIRSKDTIPEIVVRRLLFAHGYRFRLHARNLPGRPSALSACSVPSRRNDQHRCALSCKRATDAVFRRLQNQALTTPAFLRTRGSWVQILPGAPVATKGSQRCDPFFIP